MLDEAHQNEARAAIRDLVGKIIIHPGRALLALRSGESQPTGRPPPGLGGGGTAVCVSGGCGGRI
jgi:hypothetical protein